MKHFTDLKTFEQACEYLGLDATKVLPDFSCYPTTAQTSMLAHAKLVIIVRAANKLANNGEEWKPDFSNWDENKYEAWFNLSEGSSGCRFDGFDRWHSYSNVGSRLCFISREVCKHIANQFLETYKEYFL